MLPAAASLRKQGANKGATTAFLISTPESGVDSIAITYALLDPVMTVVRPLAAFVSAITAGLVENIFFWDKDDQEVVIDRSCPVDGCCDGNDCPDEIHLNHHSLREKMVAGLRFGYREVWGDIAGWFFLGVILAGLITTFIPDEFMSRFLGGGFSSMAIMLVIGIPLYICATACTPIAAALILKGVSPGAALVFLLVGPATNITSLSVLFGVLGKRSTFLYLSIIAICAVGFGLFVDALYKMLEISPASVIGEASEFIPYELKLLSVMIVLLCSVSPVWKMVCKKFSSRKQTEFISDFPQLRNHSHSGQSKVSAHADKEESDCECCK